MPKQKKYLFKYRDDLLGRLLVWLGLAPRQKHIPIFGIQGAGKSRFIYSVAYFICKRELGRMVGESLDYVTRLQGVIMNGEELDATQGYRDVDLEINRVYQANFYQVRSEILDSAPWPSHTFYNPPYFTDLDQPALNEDPQDRERTHETLREQEENSETVSCDFLLTTNDLSGAQFKDAMERLSEPTARWGEDQQTRRFIQVLEDGEGTIVIVDVVRQKMTATEFASERIEHVRHALAEQVYPLTKGIQLSIIKGSKKTKVFPLFLVFTKRDIHQFSRSELNEIVKEVFAPLLASLKDRVKIRIHSVQNMGFGEDPQSIINNPTEGVGLFLADLYYWIREM